MSCSFINRPRVVAVGVCEALDRKDKVISTHRAHAHYVAKGGNINTMIAEIYGKKPVV